MAWHARASHKSVFRLPAYSSQYNPHEQEIDGGDKIIVHNGILQALMSRFGDRTLPSPLIFEIQAINSPGRRTSHCGVLEFSADQATAFLPTWMMRNLNLREGGDVQLKLKELPQATSIVFQPLKYTFTQIPTPKLALEHALRGFTALTCGDTISIRIGDESHDLVVQDLKPDTKIPGAKNAGCVVNAQLAVDFLPPLESEPEHLKSQMLEVGVPRFDERLDAGLYKYYQVKSASVASTAASASSAAATSDLNTAAAASNVVAIRVDIDGVEGDPEIVVSTKESRPVLATAQWSSVNAQFNNTVKPPPTASSTKKSILIHPSSAGYLDANGWFYIGVYAYKVATRYHIVVNEVPADDANSDASNGAMTFAKIGTSTSPGTAASSPSSSSTPSTSAPSTDPNPQQCSNCLAYIPARAIQMHSIQCARLNVLCPICQGPVRKSEWVNHKHCDVCSAVVHPDAMDKHIDLLHKAHSCPGCNAEIAPDQLSTHLSIECPARKAECKYCHMETQAKYVDEHQQICGATTIPCDRCGQSVARRRLDIHYAVDHGINLSLRPGHASAMGAPAALSTVEAARAARREAAAFITKDEDGKPTTQVPVADLSEAEQIARAIAASMQSSPVGDEDVELQRALLESRVAAADAASNQAVAAAAASPARAVPTDTGADEEEEEEWMMDSHADGMEDEEEDTWGEEDGDADAAADDGGSGGGTTGINGSASPVRRSELACPYCHEEQKTYEALEKHMETCEAVE